MKYIVTKEQMDYIKEYIRENEDEFSYLNDEEGFPDGETTVSSQIDGHYQEKTPTSDEKDQMVGAQQNVFWRSSGRGGGI